MSGWIAEYDGGGPTGMSERRYALPNGLTVRFLAGGLPSHQHEGTLWSVLVFRGGSLVKGGRGSTVLTSEIAPLLDRIACWPTEPGASRG